MEEEYGERYMVKVDCVEHIQTRMGAALRTYKKNMQGKKFADGKIVGGKKRLTDAITDDMHEKVMCRCVCAHFFAILPKDEDSEEPTLSNELQY